MKDDRFAGTDYVCWHNFGHNRCQKASNNTNIRVIWNALEDCKLM